MNEKHDPAPKQTPAAGTPANAERREARTIDEYIGQQPAGVRPLLRTIRATIHRAAPQASERIAWRMPTFWQGGNLIHFAAFKSHIGLYPGGEYTTAFASRLAGYTTTKGSIHLPLDEPVDTDLVAEIVAWHLARLR